MKIGSVYYNDPYFAKNFGHEHVIIKQPEDVKNCDLVVLWGGEDISPSFYNQDSIIKPHKPSSRDEHERDIYELCKGKIPLLGVCRGAQLMCALGGGSLWQHVYNHNGRDHFIKMKDGRLLRTNSIHHQMMKPIHGMEVLGWAVENSKTDRGLSPKKYGAENQAVIDDSVEPELVYFPGVGVGVQGHPEYTQPNSPITYITKELLQKYCGIEL